MSIWARYAWALLPCHADRDGRLKDSAFTLKAAIFPGDEVEMEKILTELADRDHIIRYSIGGRRYIQIRTFSKHQTPHTREIASTIPEVSGENGTEHDLGSASASPGSAGVSPSPSDPDPDQVSSGSGLSMPRAPARSTDRAKIDVCQLRDGQVGAGELRRLFGAIRAREIGGMEWQSVQGLHDGRDASMADLINAQPDARVDVAPSMALLFRRAKEGRAGKDNEKILREPPLAFACWCSSWTSLLEELHGCAPVVPLAARSRRSDIGHAPAELRSGKFAIEGRKF